MPEKVHTKFGDDGAATKIDDDNKSKKTNPDLTSQKHISSAKQSGSSASPGLTATNGAKRLRDGSPKVSGAPRKEPQIDKAQKKQKGNPGINARDISRPHSAASNRSSKSTYSNAPAETRGAKGVNGPSRPNQSAVSTQKPFGNGTNSEIQNQKLVTAELARNAKPLEKQRQELPIWAKKADIRWALRQEDVLILNGETGSGKSTQTPQFLHTEPWCNKKLVKIMNKDGLMEDIAVGGVIAITEPRKVAATSLARRVAEEMGSPFLKGHTRGTVGYSVRFDSFIPVGMKIKFLTEGMLLQEMLRDPNLRQYSAVIVDEIHERSVDVDLLAGFLRNIVHSDKKGRGGVPLKVVIMSATLDLGGLEAFFAKPSSRPKYKPGQNHGKVLAPHLLDSSEVDDGAKSDEHDTSTDTFSSWSGISSSDESSSSPSKLSSERDKNATLSKGNTVKESTASPKTVGSHFNGNGASQTNDEDVGNGVAFEYVEGRQYEVKVFYDVVPTSDYLDNMRKTILKLHVTEALPGDILAFLTGQEEIDLLKKQLEGHALSLSKAMPKMQVMALYGSMSSEAQQEIFKNVREKRTRKVVLATNIAETSVTVPGVRFVIDCGKSKVKQYRPRLGMESLLVKPISKTSAIQREGRAGREGKGKCFRLYTAEDCDKFEDDEKPEILRSDVIEAVLKMKARGIDDVLGFPLMDRPDMVAMEKALLDLHLMGAINDKGVLSKIGKQIAEYPLPAVYGRVLVAAAETDCLLEVIDIVSCLTSESEIFLQPKSDEEQLAVEENRKHLHHPKGDILSYLTTMQRYAYENVDRNEWCHKHLVAVRAMKMALSIRRQLRQTALRQKLLSEMPPPDPQPIEELTNEKADIILRTFLRAFNNKTAVMGRDRTYQTSVGRNLINIHPSSVLYGKKTEAIMFLDHVFTSKSYAKKVSAIQANWINESIVM